MLFGGDATPFVGSSGTGVLTPGTITTITDDTYYNAWPAIIRMGNGNLLMTYTKGFTHHLDNSASWNGKISSDSGASWGSEFDIYGITEVLWTSVLGCSVSSSGRVFTTGFRDNGFTHVASTIGALLVYSDDYGSTWSSAVVLDAGFTDFQLGSSAPIELPGGDLIVPVEGMDSGDTLSSVRVIFSSDDGATWGSEVIVAEGTRNYYEPCIVRLNNDDLVCLLRTADSPSGDIYQSRSTDDGATWSSPALAFAGNGMPHVIQGSSGTLIACTRDSAGATVAWTSIDGATSWDGPTVLDGTMYEMEYACPIELGLGSYLVVEGYQQTSSTSNSDIKTIAVTEALA